MAASGGYLLASLGEKIFVNPSSLVGFLLKHFILHQISPCKTLFSLSLNRILGSIGIAQLDFSLGELLSSLKVTEEVRIGSIQDGDKEINQQAGARHGLASPISDLERIARERLLKENYEQFKAEIKLNLGVEDVESIAKVITVLIFSTFSVQWPLDYLGSSLFFISIGESLVWIRGTGEGLGPWNWRWVFS
jgi:hypothetical protein